MGIKKNLKWSYWTVAYFGPYELWGCSLKLSWYGDNLWRIGIPRRMPNFRNCTRTNAVEHLAKRVVGELHDWWVEFSKLHGPIYVALAQMQIFFS